MSEKKNNPVDFFEKPTQTKQNEVSLHENYTWV